MVQVVVLSANGECRTLKTAAISVAGPVVGESVAKALRKSRAAEHIGSYMRDDVECQLWGWREGKAGTENKHALPAPYEDVSLYGDAVLVGVGTDIGLEHWKAITESTATAADSESEENEESDAESSVDGENDDGDEEEVANEEDEDDDVEDDEEDDDEEEEDAEDDADDDCYEDGDDGGGGKRRAPRRRMATAPEYRRMDMGLRARVKIPTPVGKRAPRWQTADELEAEPYST